MHRIKNLISFPALITYVIVAISNEPGIIEWTDLRWLKLDSILSDREPTNQIKSSQSLENNDKE